MRANPTLDQKLEVHSLRDLLVPEAFLLIVGVTIIAARQRADFANLVSPWPAALIAGLAVGLASGALSGLLIRTTRLRHAVSSGLEPLRGMPQSILAFVLVGIAAGVCEETLFRAALQPWIGLWFASALFALAHSGTARLHRGLSLGKLSYLVASFLAGVALGLAYDRFGLVASASAHAGFDAAILIVLRPLLKPDTPPASETSTPA